MSTQEHIAVARRVNTQETKFFGLVRWLGAAASAAMLLAAAPSLADVSATPDGLTAAPAETASWAPMQGGAAGGLQAPAPQSYFAAMVARQQGGYSPPTQSAPNAAAALQPAVFVTPAYQSPFPEPTISPNGDPDLFGSVALPVGRTPEDAKWMRARDFTPSSAAGPWAGVLREARWLTPLEKLTAINTYVNRRIEYATPEAQYGITDYWADARESLGSGRGNCTAYAIAKLELLRAAGVPAGDLYLVLVKDLVRRADHAIVAVRLDGRFVILDSGADAVLSQDDVRDYRPILTYGYGRTWIHGYRETPRVIMASASVPTSPFGAMQ